jgi:hypothetical protein
LGNGHFNPVSRLFLDPAREEEKAAKDDDQDNDKQDNARHGGAFAERESRCIAPYRD